jgi:hypothetical protein
MKKTNRKSRTASARSSRAAGSALKIQADITRMMAEARKTVPYWQEAYRLERDECRRLRKLCLQVHDRLLRGESDKWLLEKLSTAWSELNAASETRRAFPEQHDKR